MRHKSITKFNVFPFHCFEQSELVVIVLSSKHFLGRQQRCINTWAGSLQKRKIPAFYVVGDTNASKATYPAYPNTLVVRGPDDVNSLTHKIVQTFKWSWKNVTFKYVFKSDDDTYVHPGRLVEFTNASAYDAIGQISEPESNPFFGGGSGYLLTRRATAAAVTADIVPIAPGYNEDLNFSHALMLNGIALDGDPRLHWGPEKERWPSPANNYITSHWIRDDDTMEAIHRQNSLTETESGSIEVDFRVPEWATRKVKTLITLTWRYRRIGYGKRVMNFLPNGTIGQGAAKMETYWRMSFESEVPRLEIYSIGSDLSCSLRLTTNQAWEGRWLNFEQMPIRLEQQ